MVIVKFQNGWGASNDATLEYKSTPQYEDKKIVSIKRTRYCTINDLYIVKGDFTGEVQFAIRDSQTGEVLCFHGVVEGKIIRVIGECSNEFLLKIN